MGASATISKSWLALRVLGWLAILPVLKRMLPLPRLVHLMWLAPQRSVGRAEQERAVRVVARLSRASGGNCLERSLLLYRYLSRANADPQLVVGMARPEEYVGHVWVTVDGQALLETPETLRDYEVVTTFADEAQRLIASPRPPRRLTPVLRIESLQRHFDSHVVLDGIDLEATAGERVAILGPNGSGKTTLLRCIAGTLTATAGSIRVAGHSAGSIEARQLTGASLSQERSFYLRLSGRENLLLFARLNGLGKRAAGARVDELAEELELEELLAQRADRCSSGQLQQLAFARALVGDPALVLLDEPTRSLDVEARGRLWAALERRPVAVAMIAKHLDEDVGHATSVIDLGDSPESLRSPGDRRDRLLSGGGA